MIQPGATRYQTSMPVAAVAKVRRATYHSHTAVFDLRDDCKMVCQKVPGYAPVISMGDPAFRFERSSPEWTTDDRLSEEPLRNDRDRMRLSYRLCEMDRVVRWATASVVETSCWRFCCV